MPKSITLLQVIIYVDAIICWTCCIPFTQHINLKSYEIYGPSQHPITNTVETQVQRDANCKTNFTSAKNDRKLGLHPRCRCGF